MLQSVRRYAGAVVVNGDDDVTAVALQVHTHVATRRRERDRIIDQVGHHLADSLPIGVDLEFMLGSDCLQFNFLLISFFLKLINYFFIRSSASRAATVGSASASPAAIDCKSCCASGVPMCSSSVTARTARICLGSA